MKKSLSHVSSNFPIESLKGLWQLSTKKKYPKYLFLTLCFNLIVAPFGFSIYLFAVMFQPEKF